MRCTRIADMVRAGEPELIEHVEKTAGHGARAREAGRAAQGQAGAGGRRRLGSAGAASERRARCWPRGSTAWTASRLRALADSLRNKWKSAVVVLASAEDGSVSIVSAVTKDLTAKVHAGKLVGAVAQAVGGKGGGRPDMAEGGRQGCAAPRLRRSRTSTQDVERQCCDRRCSTLVVVGAGPTGLACGIELQKRGVKTVLIEKGCVVNSIYHYPTNMTFFTTPELLEIGNIPMTSLNEKPNRTEALKYYRARGRSLQTRHPPVRARRHASTATTTRSRCTPPTGSAAAHVYRARKVVLATGYYDVPNLLNVPGEELDKVHALLQGAASRITTTTWRSSAPRIRPPSPRWSCGGPARA